MERPLAGGRLRKISGLDEKYLPELFGEFLSNGNGGVFPALLFGIKRMIGPVQQLLLRLAIRVVRKPSRITKWHFTGLELDRKIRPRLNPSPNVFSARSPAACPCTSLIFFSSSRSNISTVSVLFNRSARDISASSRS